MPPMEPFASLPDRIRAFWKGFIPKSVSGSPMQNPIGIVKHFKQEAVTELVKLAETQDKLEHMLSFGKGWQSQEQNTRIKGVIELIGLLVFGDNDFQQSCGVLHRARTKTGLNARLIFETVVRQKDALVAEFVTSHDDHPLALESLVYSAELKKISSVVSFALGAQCENFAISSSHKQEHCRSGYSPFGPPLFSQHHSCAVGLGFKGSKITASLAELVSGIGPTQHDDTGERSFLSTFARVSYQPFAELKVNVSGLWQTPASGVFKLGTVSIPLNNLQVQRGSNVAAPASTGMTDKTDSSSTNSAGSIALMLDSEVAESTNLGVWLEAQKSNPGQLKWGVSFSDTPYDEVGWGLKMRGMTKEHLNLQLEGFLKFSVGRNFMVQPGFVYLTEGSARTPAFIIQSSWCM